jgi:hypothetical protein
MAMDDGIDFGFMICFVQEEVTPTAVAVNQQPTGGGSDPKHQYSRILSEIIMRTLLSRGGGAAIRSHVQLTVDLSFNIENTDLETRAPLASDAM